MAQTGMLLGILLQLGYAAMASWTAYLMNTLYLEHINRTERAKALSQDALQPNDRSALTPACLYMFTSCMCCHGLQSNMRFCASHSMSETKLCCKSGPALRLKPNAWSLAPLQHICCLPSSSCCFALHSLQPHGLTCLTWGWSVLGLAGPCCARPCCSLALMSFAGALLFADMILMQCMLPLAVLTSSSIMK